MRNVVEHAAFNRYSTVIVELKRDFYLVTERRRPSPGALQCYLGSPGKPGKIHRPCDASAQVPCSHDQQKTHIPECRYRPEEPKQSDEKEAPAKAKAQPPGATGTHTQRRGRKQALLHYLGTSTELMISVNTRSLSSPSSSASGFIITRWRNTGSAADFTSSGIMKSRPSRPAAALATIIRLMAARGLAPSAREVHPRLRRM